MCVVSFFRPNQKKGKMSVSQPVTSPTWRKSGVTQVWSLMPARWKRA